MSNDLISREALKREFETLFYNDCGDFVRTERLIDDAPTVEERPKVASNYSEGWMDGYNHAIDRMFEELNYLLKSHVIEELRKRIKR